MTIIRKLLFDISTLRILIQLFLSEAYMLLKILSVSLGVKLDSQISQMKCKFSCKT